MKKLLILTVIIAAFVAEASYTSFIGSNSNSNAPTGSMTVAANWQGGVIPAGSSTGLLIATANVWPGGNWENINIRQTGGIIKGGGNLLRLYTGGKYEIEDSRTAYGTYTNLYLTGEIDMWASSPGGSVLSVLSGHVEAGSLNLRASNIINMRDGIFHVASITNAIGTVNFLAGSSGTGEMIIDMFNANLSSSFVVDFSRGSNGSITYLDKKTGLPENIWNYMIAAGQVSIDGVISTNLSDFCVTAAGTSGATLSLYRYVAFIGSNADSNAPIGSITVASNWQGGVPPSGDAIGLLSATANVWPGGNWTNINVYQTGGTLTGGGDVLYLYTGSTYGIRDVRTDYGSFTNVALEKIILWSSVPGNVTLSLLSGHIEADLLSLAASNAINIRDGIFHVGSLSNAIGAINFLAGKTGTSEMTIDMFNANLPSFCLNFESGCDGSITYLDKKSGLPSNIWNYLIAAGQVKINGVVTTNVSEFTVTPVGTFGSSLSLTPVPLRAFGVNYYDAFLRYLSNSNDTTFVQGFKYLHDHHIPVARVVAAPYYPMDWRIYFNNKQEYYRRLDYFIAQAERWNVGLILDLFFDIRTVGEIVDDAVVAGCLTPGSDFAPNNPLNIDISNNYTYAEYKRDLGRADSGSDAFIDYYTCEMVNRYANSPAIWGWECGNEYNQQVDIAIAASNVTYGCVSARICRNPAVGMTLPNTTTNLIVLPAGTGPDDLTREDAETAKTIFAQAVRSIDPYRMILSGDSVPRICAYHTWKCQNWQTDSRDEMAQVFPVDNPAPMDTLTIHPYAKAADKDPDIWFSDSPSVTNQWLTGQYKEWLDYFKSQSDSMERMLVVGEFGVAGDGTTADEKATFHRLMQALIDSGVQLSLLWTFDTRNTGFTNNFWIQTGAIDGYPASPKLYQITNDDPNLWDLEQANILYGAW